MQGVTHFPKLSSNYVPVTTEAKVDGDPGAACIAGWFGRANVQAHTLPFTMWQEGSTKLLFLDRQQLHRFKKQQHFGRDAWGVPFK